MHAHYARVCNPKKLGILRSVIRKHSIGSQSFREIHKEAAWLSV